MTVKRFVIEATFTTSGDGTTTTVYGSTKGFMTRSGDVPANTHIQGRIKHAGKVRRSLFSGTRIAGGVKPSYGEIEWLNNDGVLDVWRTYGGGGRVVVRYGDEDAAYPSEYLTVYIAYVHALVYETGQTDKKGRKTGPDVVKMRLRGREQIFDKPVVSAGFAGTGGVEGAGGVSGWRQIIAGDPAYFPPTLLDASKNLYHCFENPVSQFESSLQCFIGGVLIPRGANYTSITEMLTTAPDEGECRFYVGEATGSLFGTTTYGGPVYVRTHATPDRPIRIFGVGDDGSTRGYFNFQAMAERAGVLAADIDAGSFGAVLGALITDETYAKVMDDASLAESQWYGFTRLDRFTYDRLIRPVSGEAVHTFTPTNSKHWRREPPQDMEAPVRKVFLRTGKAYPADYAAAASDAMKDYLSREWWYSTSGESTSTRLAHPNAIETTVEIPHRWLQSQFAAEGYLQRYFELYGGRQDFWTLTAPMNSDTLDIELHDTVLMQHPTRYGMASGEAFRVIAEEIDCGGEVPTMTFGLWGGTAGTYTGTGGGSGEYEPDSDPWVIQCEDFAFLQTEDGLALLIEHDGTFVETEDGLPIYTEGQEPVLAEA
jgi:hypothetical protein